MKKHPLYSQLNCVWLFIADVSNKHAPIEIKRIVTHNIINTLNNKSISSQSFDLRIYSKYQLK